MRVAGSESLPSRASCISSSSGGDVFVAAILVAALVDHILADGARFVIDGEFDELGFFEGGGYLSPAEAVIGLSIESDKLEIVETLFGVGVGCGANTDGVFPTFPGSQFSQLDPSVAALLDGHDEGGTGFCFGTGEVLIEEGKPLGDFLFLGLVFVEETEVGSWFFRLREEGTGS